MPELNANATDVREIHKVIQANCDSVTPPYLNALKWTTLPLSDNYLVKEVLKIGEIDTYAVYACLRVPAAGKPTELDSDLVDFVTGEIKQVRLFAPVINSIKWVKPFDNIRQVCSDAQRADPPRKAFILACFVLRGHTRTSPLEPRLLFLSGLGLAIENCEDDRPLKAKRKTVADQSDALGPSRRISMTSTSQGHSVQEIKAKLQEKFGHHIPPHFNNLVWVPTKMKGASETLKIGKRNDRGVFAYFDQQAANHMHQIRIQEVNGQEIIKKDLNTIQFFEPFSRLKFSDDNKTFAQGYRSYLKGCFALHGHAQNDKVQIDLKAFIRVVLAIEKDGSSRGAEDAGSKAALSGKSVKVC